MFEQLLYSPEQITFAGLFIALLVYVMKTNDTREKQYRETITRLTKALGTLESVEEKIDRMAGTISNNREAG